MPEVRTLGGGTHAPMSNRRIPRQRGHASSYVHCGRQFLARVSFAEAGNATLGTLIHTVHCA
jgi:hypothetical protein